VELTGLTPQRGKKTGWPGAFLAELAQTASVSAACQAARVSRTIAYRRRAANQAFAESWSDALEEALDALELEARRRAVEGVERPVYYKGQECGRIRRYSDSLLIFLLKAYRPWKFRDNYAGKDPADTVQVEVKYVEEDVPEVLGSLGYVRKDAGGPEPSITLPGGNCSNA